MTFDENFIWGKTLANGEWVEVTPLSRGKKVVAIEVRFGGPNVLGVGGREPNFIFPFDPDMAGMLAEGMSAVLEALEIEGGMEEAAMRVKMEKERRREQGGEEQGTDLSEFLFNLEVDSNDIPWIGKIKGTRGKGEENE